jgi:flagella basal body P-ring formation protein FlgA
MTRNAKKPTHGLTRVGLLLLLSLPGPSALAGDAYQSHQSIRQTAVAFVTRNAQRFDVPPQVVAGDLDSRLRLPRCSQALQAFESPGGLIAGRTVVGVRCSGQQPWKLFTPVEIRLPAPVVVLAHSMRRGAVLSAADLRTRQEDLAQLRGQYYRRVADVVGYRIKRNLAGNLVLSPAMLDAQRLVRRGSEVTIVADAAAIQVRMRGKALAHGGRGDLIKVKNSRSGRVITATVVNRGVVKATP